ncbi:MAG: hypothetical protein R6U61_04990, partial [Thermoplasmata archaeon]
MKKIGTTILTFGTIILLVCSTLFLGIVNVNGEQVNPTETNNKEHNINGLGYETNKITGKFYDSKDKPIVNYSVRVYRSVEGPDVLLSADQTQKNGSFALSYPPFKEEDDIVYLGLYNKNRPFNGRYYYHEINENDECTDLGKIIVDVSKSPLTSSGNSIEISGFFYYELDGSLYPVRNAVGDVRSDPDEGDNFIATFNTNNEGYFESDITDGVYDLYVAVDSVCPGICSVSKQDGFNYHISSDTETNIRDDYYFGLIYNSGDTRKNHAFHIMDTINDCYDFIDASSTSTPDMIDVEFPSSKDRNYFDHDYYIEIKEVSGDDVYYISHEYGHALMYHLYDYDSNNMPGPTHDNHNGWSEYNEGHAVNEGWATFFGSWMNTGGGSEEDTNGNVEFHRGNNVNENGDDGDSCDKPGSLTQTGDPKDDWDGHRVEGSVAKIFTDLHDDTPDEGLNGLQLADDEWSEYEQYLAEDKINLNFADLTQILEDYRPQSIMKIYKKLLSENKVE